MAEGEKRRAEVGEEVDEASDSAAEKESSGSQDNIDCFDHRFILT